MSRLIVANLDAEADFTAQALGLPRPTLPAAARRAAADVGTLLRAMATDDDTLWLPAPMDTSRLVAVPGLPRPRVTSERPPRSRSVLAWAETRRTAGWRATAGATEQEVDRAWAARLWRLPVPSPAVVAASNDRRWLLAVGRDLGTVLPGSREVATFDDIAAADAQVAGPWVVKARFAAAGRWRYVHRGGDLDPLRPRLVRLLARHGSLVFEPWVDRQADFGVVALLGEGGDVEPVAFHRQRVDPVGRFRGLEAAARFAGPFGLTDDERTRLERTVGAVGRRLRAAGYVGPFGLDAWRYRRADGSLGFQPLGEINARMTVGLVARALIDRVRPHHAWPEDACLALRFGVSTSSTEAGDGVVSLLAPSADGRDGITLAPVGGSVYAGSSASGST